MEYVERHDLALHAWLSGQLLEPEHFERQERVLLAHMAARLRLTGLPVHGIVALELDEEQLDERVVAVKKLEWLLRDGRFFSTRGNVGKIAPLKIEVGRTNVPVHVALMPPPPPYGGAEASRPLAGIYRIELVQGEPPWDGGEVDLRREESMKLLTLNAKKDGRGLELGDYVPPLMHLSTTPFLRDELVRLYDTIEDTNVRLRENLRAKDATGSRHADVRRRWLSGQKLRALLSETGAVHATSAPAPSLRLHPYWLFSAIRDYACEVSSGGDLPFAPDALLDPESLTYDHDDLRRSFAALLRTVTREAVVPRYRSPAGLSFQREGRLFVVRDLPDAALADGNQLCLKVVGKVEGGDLVLGSPLRLQALHAGLLKGIALRPLPNPEGELADARYYQLDCRGEDWRHAQRERSLCFQRVPGVESLRAELLWRDTHGAA